MSLSPHPSRRHWRRAGIVLVAALTATTLSAAPAFAGPGDTFDPGSISDAILDNAPGASDTFDPTIPWLGDGRPLAAPAAPTRFPTATNARNGATSGIAELQLSTPTFLRIVEQQAHDQLRTSQALINKVKDKTGGQFAYRDTILSGSIIAAAPSGTEAPKPGELLIASDLDMAVSPTTPGPGPSVVHLYGQAWFKVTPTEQNLSFQLVDGYLDVPGLPQPLPLKDGGTDVGGVVPFPSLPAGFGAGFTPRLAFDVHDGTGGTVALRFQTSVWDSSSDLDSWAGSRLSGEAAALFLPAAPFVREASDELEDKLIPLNQKVPVLHGSCCSPEEWIGQHVHIGGGIRFRGAISGPLGDIEKEANWKIDLDVTGLPSVDAHGNFLLGVTTAITWNSDQPGIVDGLVDGVIHDNFDPPAGTHSSGGDDNTIEFTTDHPEVIGAPPITRGLYFSSATTVEDGYLASMSIRPDAPNWTESGPRYGKCSSTLTEPLLTVANHGWANAPLPILLAPPEVTPGTVGTSTRSVWEDGTMANAVEISFTNWRRLPVGTTVHVRVLTDLGPYDWAFTVPVPRDQGAVAEEWSECHPPIVEPGDEFDDCWACGVVIDPTQPVIYPVLEPVIRPIRPLSPILIGR